MVRCQRRELFTSGTSEQRAAPPDNIQSHSLCKTGDAGCRVGGRKRTKAGAWVAPIGRSVSSRNNTQNTVLSHPAFARTRPRVLRTAPSATAPRLVNEPRRWDVYNVSRHNSCAPNTSRTYEQELPLRWARTSDGGMRRLVDAATAFCCEGAQRASAAKDDSWTALHGQRRR